MSLLNKTPTINEQIELLEKSELFIRAKEEWKDRNTYPRHEFLTTMYAFIQTMFEHDYCIYLSKHNCVDIFLNLEASIKRKKPLAEKLAKMFEISDTIGAQMSVKMKRKYRKEISKQ